MANSNPQVENLKLGRGKRPKLNNISIGMRISPNTKERLEEIAKDFGCIYGGKPWIAGLLEKIGSNELIVSQAPSYLIKDSQQTERQPTDGSSKPRDSGKNINDIFEDEIVDRYGSMSDIASESGISQKEFKNGSEHHSVSSNSD